MKIKNNVGCYKYIYNLIRDYNRIVRMFNLVDDVWN